MWRIGIRAFYRCRRILVNPVCLHGDNQQTYGRRREVLFRIRIGLPSDVVDAVVAVREWHAVEAGEGARAAQRVGAHVVEDEPVAGLQLGQRTRRTHAV